MRIVLTQNLTFFLKIIHDEMFVLKYKKYFLTQNMYPDAGY